jgi:hypothetical protein
LWRVWGMRWRVWGMRWRVCMGDEVESKLGGGLGDEWGDWGMKWRAWG